MLAKILETLWASPHFKRVKTPDDGQKHRPNPEQFTIYDIAPWLINTVFDPVVEGWNEDDELDWMQAQVNSVLRAEDRDHGNANH